jgi:hypothetical protein
MRAGFHPESTVPLDETDDAIARREGACDSKTDDASTDDRYVDSNQSRYIIRKP